MYIVIGVNVWEREECRKEVYIHMHVGREGGEQEREGGREGVKRGQ